MYARTRAQQEGKELVVVSLYLLFVSSQSLIPQLNHVCKLHVVSF